MRIVFLELLLAYATFVVAADKSVNGEWNVRAGAQGSVHCDADPLIESDLKGTLCENSKEDKYANFFRQLLVASALVLPVAAQDATLNGKWQIKQSIGGNENSQTCTFTQKGSDLTGSCSGEQGMVQISGKVDDKNVSWSFKTEYNGSPLTVKYAGTVDAQKKITGVVTVEEFSVQGDFTATPAQ